MGDQTVKEIIVEAKLVGTYEGLARVLIDCERFGFELCSLSVRPDENDTIFTARLHLSVPGSASTEMIKHRLLRHRSVREIMIAACDESAGALSSGGVEDADSGTGPRKPELWSRGRQGPATRSA